MNNQMIKDIGKIIVSIMLLTLCGFLFSWAVSAPEASEGAGFGGIAGTIIGAILTYWLKP